MNTLRLLKELVSINSVFPNERRISQFIEKYLTNLGFTVDQIPTDGRNNLIATFGKSNKYLGFYGHLDTVPPDINLTRDPYSLVVKGGKAFGLGAADMKGGITAILKLAEYAVGKNLSIKIIFGVDEEDISRGAHDLVDSKKLNNMGFLVAAESGQVKNVNQAYNVCFGRKGRISLELITSGVKSHAADRNGKNAITEMAKLVTRLDSMSFKFHPNLGSTFFVIHAIYATTDSLSVPDTCRCIVSVFTTPLTKRSDIILRIKSLAKELGIVISVQEVERKTPYAESYEVDYQNAFIRRLINAEFKPESVMPIYTESVADENIFANRLHIPVITVGPIGGGDHTSREWVSLSSIDNLIECYKRILSLYHNGISR